MPEEIWKSIRVKEETHKRFKVAAALLDMTHDEFATVLMNDMGIGELGNVTVEDTGLKVAGEPVPLVIVEAE